MTDEIPKQSREKRVKLAVGLERILGQGSSGGIVPARQSVSSNRNIADIQISMKGPLYTRYPYLDPTRGGLCVGDDVRGVRGVVRALVLEKGDRGWMLMGCLLLRVIRAVGVGSGPSLLSCNIG